MNGNDHTGVGLVADSGASKHPLDELAGSHPPPHFPPLDSRGSFPPDRLKDADTGFSRLLTVGEVATLLGVPAKWVYRHARLNLRERIPHLKMGKYLRFRESDLRDYVERLRRP